MNDLIQTLLQEFRDRLHDIKSHIKKRDTEIHDVPNKIKVAVGMRRTGKTYLLLQKIIELVDAGVNLSSILYLNFEDDRLLPLTLEKAAALIDNFYALYPENHDNLCYLVLDEIQNVPNWATLVRRLYDTKKVQIYLSGSSAKLLSKEIATSLRGRSIATEIWPYSFQEYLRAKQIALPKSPIGQKNIDKLKQNFVSFMECGGFPEIVGLEMDDRIRILQDYVDVVVFRDIIERHKITNISLIKYMINTLLKNCATSFSVNKFFNELKSQGFAISRDTVYEYLGYIEDAYLSFTVSLYTESVRKAQTNPRKIYAIDTGLVKAYTESFSKNLGRMFENIVYLDLRRQGYKVFYYLTNSRYEVDFLVKSLRGDMHLYQVVWDDTNSQVMEREQRALDEAEAELGIEGKIITVESYLQCIK